MNKIFNSITILIFISILSSCGRDEIITSTPITQTSSSGAFILSEGGFTPGTSMLSYYNHTSGSFNVSIFNPGALGITPDGMIKDGDNLYITEQGSGASGKIYRTDLNGTVLASSSVGVSPYSLTEANNKLYITNGPANSVAVVDKATLTTLSTINVGLYPQEILAIGNKVFVCNTSVFSGGTDSTVSVIDAATDAVTNIIQVRKTPSALAKTTDNKVLIGCPGDVSNGIIFKVDPVTFNKIDSFKNFTKGFCKDIAVKNSNEIYFISGDVYAEGTVELYNLNSRVSATVIPKISNEINYGLAFDPNNQLIYVCIAASNFTSSGKFRVFSEVGFLLNEFNITTGNSIGIAPRRIVVKN